jgi:signal transduction histidine kinase
MGSIDFAEAPARLIYIHLSQITIGFIFFFIFRHFGNLYRRFFLHTWAYSWIAFAIYITSSGIVMLYLVDERSLTRTIFSVIAQLSCFLQIIYILRGTYELIYGKAFSRRRFSLVLLLSIAIALVSIIAFSQSGVFFHYLISNGSRAIVTGIGFLLAGIVVWTNKKFTKGFGQQLLTTSLILFSIYQLYNFTVRLLNVLGKKTEGLDLFGSVDLLLISLIGMGMVMWFLEDERERLNEENKELDSFLSSTSHDLRTPIASILGLTYLGRIELQEEKARTFMNIIEERIKKLDLIISDILNLSRSKKIDVKIEELDLRELLEETTADIKFNKGASSIFLDYQAHPSHIFKSDYNQIKIILNNLLTNAVKYHNLDQPHPFIKVTFKRNRHVVEISVEDNGRGISREDVPKIFDMFFRAAEDTDGTGLGLYIVKEALNKIKGIIFVDSELGEGSKFRIVLENA